MTGFAAHIGMAAPRLAAMLAGSVSIDVDSAVRLSRALQLNAERIMQMQTRHDFSQVRRAVPNDGSIGVARPPQLPDFPAVPALAGRLRRSPPGNVDSSLFFQEEIRSGASGGPNAGIHALWRGDRLRVYAPDGSIIWVGPILHDLDGNVMLPFVRTGEWLGWFVEGYRADLAVGDDHAAFFARMTAEG